MMALDELKNALAPDPEAVRVALVGAERELRDLQARQAELEGLIGQARAVLGLKVGDRTPDGELVVPLGGMKLHEAMEQVLRTQPEPMTSRDLADVINDQGLYRQKRGGPIPASQVSARANRYPHMFVKAPGGLIALKETLG